MKKKTFEVPLWTQENPDICRFCAFAKPVAATEDVYCEKKKTFLNEEETCRKFKYDILKKELRRRRSQTVKYDAKQFEI